MRFVFLLYSYQYFEPPATKIRVEAPETWIDTTPRFPFFVLGTEISFPDFHKPNLCHVGWIGDAEVIPDVVSNAIFRSGVLGPYRSRPRAVRTDIALRPVLPPHIGTPIPHPLTREWVSSEFTGNVV